MSHAIHTCAMKDTIKQHQIGRNVHALDIQQHRINTFQTD